MFICCTFVFYLLLVFQMYFNSSLISTSYTFLLVICMSYAAVSRPNELMPFPMYTFFSFFFSSPLKRHADKVGNYLLRELTHWALRTRHSSWLAKLGLWPPNTSLESFGTAIINYWKQKKKRCNFSDKIKITTMRPFNLPERPSCNSKARSGYLSSAVPSKL